MKIIGVPFLNGLGRTKGCEKACDFILEDLKDVYSNSYKTVLSEYIDYFKMNLEGDIHKNSDIIYDEAFDIYSKDRVFFIGGDHSVSYPLSRAFFDWSQYNGREPALVVFDAHLDLMEPVDKDIPTHEEWLRALIEDGFNPENILIVGIRNSHFNEIEYLKKKGVKFMSMQDLFLDYLNKIDAITEFGYGKDLYVSFDIDFVDLAYAPGTGFPEVGGSSSKEFLYIVSRIAKVPTLRGVDLVEINPDKDISRMTSKLGAKILAEFL